MSWSKGRGAAVAILLLIVALFSGATWRAYHHPTQVVVGASPFAYPVGPAQVNGQDAGTYPNLTLVGLQCPGGRTTATVNSGQTYAVQPCDRVIRFIEDAGAAKAILPSNPTYGEEHSLPWLAWSIASPTPPVVNANAVDGGALMVPFAGQQSPAPGGLVTTTTINSPGNTGTWMWDGTEWVTP